jgi:hypothetical protein
MKIVADALNITIKYAKQFIISKKQYINLRNKRYLAWPLFFSDETQQFEEAVDVCTSGLGVISASHFLSHNTDRETLSALRDGVSTLLFVRNDDGSWPSKISLVSKDSLSMEGVISDTFFALSALMHVGFLSNTPTFSDLEDPKNSTQLNTLDNRLAIIQQSLRWLLDNRVSQGWGYTSVRYLENPSMKNVLPSYTLPSANSVIIMSEILKEVYTVKPDFCLVTEMQQAIDATVNWFCEIQNKDGGFGIKRGEKSRIGSTARVVIALSQVSVPSELVNQMDTVINKAIKWLLSNYHPTKVKYEDVCEDFSQVIIETINGVSNVYKRSIIHESFLEPLIIDALRLYYEKYLCQSAGPKRKSLFKSFLLINKVCTAIKNAISFIISRQLTEGEFQGAIKSRRSAPNEWYTMYTCCDSICAFDCLLKNRELFIKVQHVTLRNKIFMGVYLVLIAALLIPALISQDPWWLMLLISVVNPIASGLITNTIEKILGSRD